ncbi:MAG: hypothetical protein ACD_54C00052G0001 [uncultured bacterium]|nr:MAG: hypothetical protein ACD_54C00052G0001 [uncultured bacterium]
MHKADHIAQSRAQAGETCLGAGVIDQFGILDQRADPIGLPPLGHRLCQMTDDLIHPRARDQRCLDRLATGRLFVQHRDIHIAITGQRKAARDRRGGHYQHICRLPLCTQLHPLRHAKAVLFIDHSEPKILKLNVFLEYRVGSHQDLDLPIA